MHELSLVSSVIEQVQRHADGAPVKTITLSVGVLTCVDPGAMQFCFEACRQEVGMGDTELIIQLQHAQGRCRHCGATFDVITAIQPCECGSLDIELNGGDDVLLSELELV